MKRNFFLSVFALFFAVFGGVGVAYADYFPECQNPIPIEDIHRDVFDNTTVETFDVSSAPNWTLYLTDGAIMYGTSFCSAEGAVAPTPSVDPGSYCWCGLTRYYDGYESSLSTPTTWKYSGIDYDGDPGTCSADCAHDCATLVSNDHLSFGNGVGICEGFYEECQNSVPINDFLDPNYCSARPEGWNENGINWEARFSGGQMLNGFAFCSLTDENSSSSTPESIAGQHCWCGFTQYNDGNTTFYSDPITWAYQMDLSDISTCEIECSARCREFIDNQYCDVTFCDTAALYNISYECNTGEGASEASFPLTTVANGGTFTTPASNACSRTGYTFANWAWNANGTGTTMNANTQYTFSFNTDKTLYAQWTQNNYTVSFAAGTNGSGTMSSQTNKHYGDTITLPASTFTASTGYTFNGWSCNQGIGNKAAGATFSMPAADVTCTAQWTATASYTVSFAAGTNGSGTMSSQTNKHYGDTITLPANGFTASSGYMFTGWNCNQGIGNKAAGATFPMPAANVTCTAQWTQITYPFSLTTTSLTASNRTFTFDISAAGTFYVDCGSGGTLSGTGVSGGTITKNSATVETYTCTYTTNGTKTIRFGGLATAYYSTSNTIYAAISFYNSVTNSHTKVASINGSLSQIFPYLGSSVGQFPRFNGTFQNCTHLTSIPNTLFSSLTGSGSTMFAGTFTGCTGLTSIPSGLFNFNGSNVSGADSMFSGTFANCTGLTGTNAIPSNLFSRVTSSAASLFDSTFSGCSGLTQLPSGLFGFGGNTVAGAPTMFSSTFSNCTSLTSLPNGLFGSFSSGGTSMFLGTFDGCSGLTSLPNGLFTFTQNLVVEQVGGLDRSYMFARTFLGCSGLTSLPSDLFSFGSHTATGSDGMFESTFQNCTNLASIPAGLFSNIISGAPYLFSSTFAYCSSLQNIPSTLFNFHNSNSVTGQSGMFHRTFYRCSGITSLPDGLFARITSTANNMFQQTFANCTGLTGYIPTDFFARLIANNHPYTTDMMEGLFSNTGSLRTTSTGCPSGTTQYITGYESYWDSHISCQASSYTITYHDTSDCSTALSGLTPTTYTSSAAVSLPTPTRTGYTCNGWNGCTNGNISASTGWAAGTITGNVAVYKNCTGNNIPVYFDSDSSSCNYGSTLTVPQPTRTGYVFMGWKLQCSLYGLETGSDGVSYGYVDGNSNSNNAGGYNLTQTNTFATEFDWGTVYGEARCSTTSGTTQGQHGTPSTTTGEYCWCAITSYRDFENQCTISHPNWVYMDEPGPSDCENVCALNCAEGIQNSSEFREAAFGRI